MFTKKTPPTPAREIDARRKVFSRDNQKKLAFLTRGFLALNGVLGSASVFADASAEASAPAENLQRPNIVIFVVDDMSDWISPMGYEQAKTPDLDRLADIGTTFQNAHTPGVYCAPARTAIFSGRFASTTGVYGTQRYFVAHPEIKPLQVALQEAGYLTYGGGKLFHHTNGNIDFRGWVFPPQRRTEARRVVAAGLECRGWSAGCFQLIGSPALPQQQIQPERGEANQGTLVSGVGRRLKRKRGENP